MLTYEINSGTHEASLDLVNYSDTYERRNGTGESSCRSYTSRKGTAENSGGTNEIAIN